MSNFTVQSHRGEYSVNFVEDVFSTIEIDSNTHILIDQNILKIYKDKLEPLLSKANHVSVQASEEHKDLTKIPSYIQQLVNNGIKRNHSLLAIGGGITQDITCYIANNIFRGIHWSFIPTTLLAQADSCIGSKNSINVSGIKNLVGSFCPPKEIHIDISLLESLELKDVKSGIGEIYKVFMIDSYENFLNVSSDYKEMLSLSPLLKNRIKEALTIKKGLIEKDEFDKGIRNIMNYGHSFGHALESATSYELPHGTAVTIGMDMANFVSYKLGLWEEAKYLSSHEVFKENYKEFNETVINHDVFFSSISKDKKNVGSELVLILNSNEEGVHKRKLPNDDKFRELCFEYFNEQKGK